MVELPLAVGLRVVRGVRVVQRVYYGRAVVSEDAAGELDWTHKGYAECEECVARVSDEEVAAAESCEVEAGFGPVTDGIRDD